MPASMSYAGASLTRTGLTRTGSRLSMSRMRPKKSLAITQGTELADVLVGWAGPDSISGGLGNDVIRAGSGNDTIIMSSGNSTIDAGPGIDTLDFSAATTGIDVRLLIPTPQTVKGGLGVDLILNAENVIGGAYNDTITGTLGADISWGMDGDDILTTNLGHDTAYGGAGNDNLYGNGGDDLLVGGDGNDSLYGNGGVNTLVGGTGSDVFYVNTSFSVLSNKHIVTDFEPGVDKISIPKSIYTVFTVGQVVTLGTYLYYDQNTGLLSYSATNDQSTALVIANFGIDTHPNISSTDFVVTA